MLAYPTLNSLIQAPLLISFPFQAEKTAACISRIEKDSLCIATNAACRRFFRDTADVINNDNGTSFSVSHLCLLLPPSLSVPEAAETAFPATHAHTQNRDKERVIENTQLVSRSFNCYLPTTLPSFLPITAKPSSPSSWAPSSARRTARCGSKASSKTCSLSRESTRS